LIARGGSGNEFPRQPPRQELSEIFMRSLARLVVVAVLAVAGPSLACKRIHRAHAHHGRAVRFLSVGADFGPRVGFSVALVRHASYVPPPLVEVEEVVEVAPPLVDAEASLPAPPPPPPPASVPAPAPAPVVVVQQQPPPPPPARVQVREEATREEPQDPDRQPLLAIRWAPVGFLGMGAVEPTRMEPVDLLTGISSGSVGAELRLFNGLFGSAPTSSTDGTAGSGTSPG
jgi:hypothetical protein